MNKLLLSVATIGLTSVALFSSSYANNYGDTYTDESRMEQRKERMQEKRALRMEKAFDKVGVTDSQRAQIQAIHESYKPQMENLRQQGKQLREDKQNLDATSANYVAQTQAIFDQRSAHKRKIVTLKAQMRHEVANVLTAEQRAELKELRAENKGKRKQRRKKRMRNY